MIAVDSPALGGVTVKAMFSNDSVVKEFSMDGGEDWQLFHFQYVIAERTYKRKGLSAQSTARESLSEVEFSDSLSPLQIDFLKSLFAERKLDRYYRAAEDIIKFYGAISRTTDTGKSETIQLNYNAEYVEQLEAVAD